MSAVLRDVGAVVIGRNEGARLLACLDSLRGRVACVVYADSASHDGSPERARERGAEVVALDASRPTSAARGRNAGFARLAERRPDLAYVFFVDGDCALVPGFLEAARAELERDPGLGAVCGRRREVAPDASPYNRAVDCEWDTPVGEAEAFGGDVLVRVAALRAVAGYDERLPQGEDPELAFRLRRAGWRIQRIAAEMTRHDVALHTFSAWSRRHRRGGYAYAHAAALHWGEPGAYNRRACASILAWGCVLPLVALLALVPTGGASALLLAAYARVWLRVRAARRARGDAPRVAALYATLVTLGKLQEARGVLRCLWDLASGRRALCLEYKPETPAGEARRAA